MSRRSKRGKQHRTKTQEAIFWLIAIMVVSGIFTFYYNENARIIIGVIFAIPIIFFILLKIRKHLKQRLLTSEIGKYLHQALKFMDSTAKWYNDENEANRELVTSLKAQGIKDVIYQYRLNNGRTADAKVGNILIEGKLSPTTEDVDRLLGQLTSYTQTSYKVNVVIYGNLHPEAKKRIINEIESRYFDKVFLTYLNNPQRTRNVERININAPYDDD